MAQNTSKTVTGGALPNTQDLADLEAFIGFKTGVAVSGSPSRNWTLQSGVIGSTGIRRVEVNFSPAANSLSVEGVAGDSNADATALPTLTTWRLLNGLGGTTPWNGNVPLISLGQAA